MTLMMKQHMENEKAKKIDRAIRLTWESLESHLHWTHKKSSEGLKFHRKCIKDYAEIIKILSELY